MSAVSLSLLLLSASFAAASLSPAVAQSAAPAQQATAGSPDAIKQREEELEATREQQRKAAELQQKLKADIAAIGQDRSKLNQQLIDIATQVRSVETRIGETEAGLRPLDSPRAAGQGFARFTPHRNRRGAGGTATRRPAHAAGAAGPARRRAAIAAHRHAARIGRPRTARTRGETCRRSRRTRECAQDASPPSATCWRGTATG